MANNNKELPVRLIATGVIYLASAVINKATGRRVINTRPMNDFNKETCRIAKQQIKERK